MARASFSLLDEPALDKATDGLYKACVFFREAADKDDGAQAFRAALHLRRKVRRFLIEADPDAATEARDGRDT